MHGRLLQEAQKIRPLAILIANKDILIPLQYSLATALGLPHANQQAVETSLDKLQQKTVLAEAGLPQGKWRVLCDQFEINDLHGFPYPAVIKPSIGTASKGITRVTNACEIAAGLEYIQSWQNDASVGNEFFIEEYVEGRQFDVEGLAFEGQIYPICIVEENYSGDPRHFPPHFFLFNPPLDKALHQLIEATAIDTIRALGVTIGAWHCELRITSENRPCVLDYANRMGYDRLVSLAAGIDFADSYIDTMLGQSPNMLKKTRKTILFYYLTRLAEVAPWQVFVRENSNLIRSSVFKLFTFSVASYYGKVVVVADSYDEIYFALQKCGVDTAALPEPSGYSARLA